MSKLNRVVLVLCVCFAAFTLYACGKEPAGSSNEAIYGKTVGGLQDDELFAVIEAGAASPILLVTSQVYDDGHGNRAAVACDVYYVTGGEVKKIGVIESSGTAYPIAYDKEGIYAASGQEIQRFRINEKNGGIELEGKVEEYGDAVVVNFGYGAS